MSARSIVVAALAVGCGLTAMLGVRQLRVSRGPVEKPDTVEIVVAAADVPRGKITTRDSLRLCPWPKELLPPGALTRLEDAQGRATLAALVAGEPVLGAKLASRDAGRGLAPLIPRGMRACTIQASRAAVSVAGFILPGNKVDVLLTLKGHRNDDTGGGSTTTLLQCVEILAVNQQLDAPAENKINPKDLSSVTLLVNPDQAKSLELGQNLGQLTLVLRNPEDDDESDSAPATLAEIRFRQDRPAPAPTSVAASVAVQPEEKPQEFAIATLHGNQWGRVVVQRR